MLRPVVLTGGPAVGKTSTARLLASTRSRATVVDVDDVRLFFCSGGAAPWAGAERFRQQYLGVENARGLARRFLKYQIDVMVADVVTVDTAALYRQLLPDVVLVRLVVPIAEARQRAARRLVHLTDEEFDTLHVVDRSRAPATGHSLEVAGLNLQEQTAAVEAIWSRYQQKGLVGQWISDC